MLIKLKERNYKGEKRNERKTSVFVNMSFRLCSRMATNINQDFRWTNFSELIFFFKISLFRRNSQDIGV